MISFIHNQNEILIMAVPFYIFLQVVPRKKFKCPECVKEMLSASSSHMVHRSACINMFIELYGGMPLKPIEFRADPLLYKDNLPGVLRKFRDLGTL